MSSRTLLMYVEMGCFCVCVCGWLLICTTVSAGCWAYSEVDSVVLTSSHYFSNLWKDCVSDSTGMFDCKPFPSLLALQTYIHLCRSFVITSILLGLFGSALALVGMKCTKLGGPERINAKVTFAAGMSYLLAGLCGTFAYSWYGRRVISEFMDPNYRGKRFELGAALFLGWGGSALLMVGGMVYSCTAGNEACQHSSKAGDLLYEAASCPCEEQQKSISPQLSPIPERAPTPTKPLKASYGMDAYV